jgi:hypothetical protein
MAATIKLTIYNAEHESVNELSTALVPWGILKRAVKLAKSLGTESLTQEQVLEALGEEGFDNLTALVADLYHGRVTIEELEWGTEASEMLAVLQAVVTRAFAELGSAGPDPTPPGK